MTDLSKYLMQVKDYGMPTRFSTCPFCGPVSSKGFVVTRTHKGYIMWCHRCHKKSFEASALPSFATCLSLYRSRNVPRDTSTTSKVNRVELPRDIVYTLPVICQIWLSKYSVTQEEVAAYKFGWSQSLQRLILPVYDSKGTLIYWQGRYFGTNANQRKYLNISMKRKDVWFDTQNVDPIDTSSTFSTVVVEDIISAIAVRRSGSRAIALLGSYLGDDLILAVLSEGRQVVVWLDPDKMRESIKSSRRLRALGVKAKSVLNCKTDPKLVTPKQMKEAYLK